MGTYFNPSEDLPRVARKIEGVGYQELTTQLKDGEKLFGHYNRAMFQNAVHLYSEAEFDEFEHPRNTAERLGFYAMPADVFEKHCTW